MTTPDATIAIPISIARHLDELMRDDAAVEVELRREFLEMCASAANESSWGGNEALAEQWIRINAEGIAHLGQREADEEVIRLFRKLESIVLRVFEYAPSREERIKALAENATPETVVSALQELVTLHDHFVFYQSLNRADLLEPLREAGAMEMPRDFGSVFWPQADYLANVAEHAPSDVASILLPLNTQYAGTSRQLAAVALKLPDDELAHVADRAPWLHRKASFAFLEGFIAIIRRLVSAGNTDLAFRLGSIPLRFDVEPPQSQIPGFDHPRAVPQIGKDYYGLVLDREIPILLDADPLRVVEMLAKTLNAVIRAERYETNDVAGMWYRDMLAAKTPTYEIKGQLTDALVHAAITAAASDLSATLAILEKQWTHTRLYRRLSIAVVVAREDDDSARRFMECSAMWTVEGPEHLALVQRFYPRLSEERRESVAQIAYDYIDGLLRPYYKAHGVENSDIDSRIVANVAARFGSAQGDVPAPLRERLDNLSRIQAAEPKQQAVPSLEELGSLTTNELPEVLQHWTPQHANAWDVSWSIGTSVRMLLQENAGSWLLDTDLWKRIPPYYLGWALNGVLSYRNQGTSDSDSAVLSVAHIALQRVASLEYENDAFKHDVARHIAQGVGLLLADLAKTIRSETQVRDILELTARLSEVDDQQEDAAEISWTAPNAALGYARGLAIHILGELLRRSYHRQWSTEAILEAYDTLSKNATMTVRGALGQFFSWFATVDPQRAICWAQRIFMSGDANADRAAWCGYVTFSDVNQQTYELLRPAYADAIEDLLAKAEDEPEQGLSSSQQSREARIIQERTLWHLWVLAANRVEPFSEPHSLGTCMIAKVDARLLEHLASEIARSLRAGDDSSNIMVNEEAMRFWELLRSRVHDGLLHSRVLSSLSAWAGIEALPAEWRLRQVGELIGVIGIAHVNAFDLIDALITLANTNMEKALQILERVAKTLDVAALSQIQTNAGPLLRSAVRGDERLAHLGQSINSILVTNHRPNLLEDPNLEQGG